MNFIKYIPMSFYLFVAIVDVLCKLNILGWSLGIRMIENDPGKHFFHLVLVPVSCFLLTNIIIYLWFMQNIITDTAKKLFLIISFLLFISSAMLAIKDVIDVRDSLITISNKDKIENEISDWFRGRIISPDDITDSATIKVNNDEHEVLRTNLKKIFNDFIILDNNDKKILSDKRLSAKNNYLKNIHDAENNDIRFSVRFYVSTFETFMGIFFCFILLITTILYFFSRKLIEMAPGIADKLLFCTFLMAIWIPLRMYSEWFTHFSFIDFSRDYAPFIPAIIAIYFMASLLAVIYARIKSDREASVMVAGGVMLTSIIVAIVPLIKPVVIHFPLIADIALHIGLLNMIPIYVMFTALIVIMVPVVLDASRK